MAYQDVILADTPLRYWPLNETSGTSATDLVAGEVATAVGLTMGGGDGPTGLGGKVPVFTGTEHIELRNGLLLGGDADWTVEAWVNYAPVSSTDATVRVFYSEMGSSGNDVISCRLNGGNSTVMSHSYSDDAGGATLTAGVVFIWTSWHLLTFTRSGANIEIYYDAGPRLRVGGSGTGSTWTNAAPKAWLGMTPRSTSGWVGMIAHAAVWDRKLTQAEIWDHYKAGTEAALTRESPNRTWWLPNSPWRQRLDDPLNEPTIASNSTDLVTKLVGQTGSFNVSTNAGGGPFYVMDNSTPLSRVRIEGGQNNFSLNHPDLYNAFGRVPVPAGMIVGSGGDQEVAIYNSDTDELWEFWVTIQTMIGVEFVNVVAFGTGTIPAGTYFYAAVPYTAASAERGLGKQSGTSVSPNGSQGVKIAWGTSVGAVLYQVWRRPSSSGIWHRIATVDSTVHDFVDDGSITPDVGQAGLEPQQLTTDWGCRYGGYINGTDQSLGVYAPPHQNWGASATSLPLWAGTITALEAEAAATDEDAIQHGIAMAIVDTANSHVYPAQRHDFFSGANNIPEGTRYQLDPTFDISTIANPFQRAVAKAFQIYGGIVRDHAGAITLAYVEDTKGLGRNPYPYAYGGKQSFEVFSGFPFSSMRVIDPAWTLQLAAPPPPATGGGPYWGMRL